MHSSYSLVDCMLQIAFIPLQTVKRFFNIIFKLCLLQVGEILIDELLEIVYLLNETCPYVRGKIEIESRDSLSAVHLILSRLERYAGYHACRLDSLCRARFAMTCHKPVLQDTVERVLHASEALCWVIILVVDMDIVVFYRILYSVGKKVVVNERFGSFGSELHHHTGRRIRVHIGILAGYVVVLRFDYFQEHVAGLCLSGNRTLVAVCDIFLGYILTCGFHQFEFHGILNLLHSHAMRTVHSDTVGYLLNETFVLATFGGDHGLSYGRLDFVFIISDNPTVAFLNNLYHNFGNLFA